MEACHIYVSYDSILIRPYIPPSLTHQPFAQATQRVYMSATLGLGGDLERTTGVRRIHRLPIPVGWDKQGIGRRYFIFPELSLRADEITPLTESMVEMAGRALILVPSEWHAKEYRGLLAGRAVFSAKDIEISKDEFVRTANGVAILANRYDGIDLLGDDCRLLVIEGLPKAANLQERFLMSRMASGTLLSDRIRTRIIQAVGRCTRSATDYAAVVMIGEDFVDWLILDEKRSLFHPELQGELVFGAEQAEGLTTEGFLENLKVFLEHDDEWDEVDADIREYRDEATQDRIPGESLLFQAAQLEVDYQFALWNEDYEAALEKAQEVAGILTGDQLKGLRGWWYYLAASAAGLAFRQLQTQSLSAKAADLYRRASACVPAIGWLRVLAIREGSQDVVGDVERDEYLESNLERIEMLFDAKGYASPRRFEKDAKEIMDGLMSDESNVFEEAHRRMGELLGFESGNADSDAAPDPWWISNGKLCLVSEAKSDSKPENAVPVKHARQVASHPKWIRDNIALGEGSEIHAVIISPATKIHREVPTYADDTSWLHLDEYRKWAQNAINALRKLRASFTGPDSSSWRDVVRTDLRRHQLDPKSVVARFRQKRLRDLDVG